MPKKPHGPMPDDRPLSARRATPADCGGVASERDRYEADFRNCRLELERQNAKLRRSRAHVAEIADRYAELYEFAPVGLFLLDADCRVVEANLTGIDLLGREPSEVRGAEFSRWVKAEAGDPFRSACRLTQRLRRSISGEVRLIRADGTPLLARVEIAPVIGRPDRVRVALIGLDARERIDQELRHNRELLQGITDTIPVMVAIYDPNLRRFEVNREFQRVLGWTEEDLESGDPMEMCYPDPNYREMVRCYMESLEPGWRDFEVRAKGGDIVDSAWANLRLTDETHVGIGIDMRGRRAADQQLRESRERLRLATEAAGLGVFEWHIATDRAVWENPRMYEIFGRPPNKGPVGKAELLADIIHPEDAPEFERQLAAAARSEAPWRTTFRIRTADGQTRTLEALGLFVGSGPERLVGVVADTSERVRIENELHEYQDGLELRVRERTRQLKAAVEALQAEAEGRLTLENRLRQISRVFMDAADPIIIEDPAGVILEVNREAEQAYGWSRGELIGRPIAVLFPPGTRERSLGFRKRCLQGEEIRNVEDVRVDRHGRTISVLTTAFPLYADGGQVVAVATIAKDISARKEMEHKLRQSEEQLRELSRKSLEALEADRRAVSRELHDSIGGSLAALKFMLEEMAEDARGGGRVAAAALDNAAAYLTDAIHETKRISVNLRPLTLDDLGLIATIKSHLRQFQSQFGAVRILPEIELREDQIAEAHKIVLYRLLQESLVNVVRHSGADTVHVRLRRHPAGGGIELEVRDNGQGFDPERKRPGRSDLSGYGLKSMQERVEICNGSFSVESRPGGGTCVRAVLPE